MKHTSFRLGLLLAVPLAATTACAVIPNPTSNQTQVVTQVQSAPEAAATTQAVSIQGQGSNAQTTSVQTANTEGLQAAVYAFLVRQDAQGAEFLVPVTQSMPISKADIIEYQGHFTNTAKDRVRATTVSMEIPAGVELVGGVEPMGALASINGHDFSRMPLRAHINGELVELSFSYYKGLRWQVENIGINGTAVVKYRAKLK